MISWSRRNFAFHANDTHTAAAYRLCRRSSWLFVNSAAHTQCGREEIPSSGFVSTVLRTLITKRCDASTPTWYQLRKVVSAWLSLTPRFRKTSRVAVERLSV